MTAKDTKNIDMIKKFPFHIIFMLVNDCASDQIKLKFFFLNLCDGEKRKKIMRLKENLPSYFFCNNSKILSLRIIWGLGVYLYIVKIFAELQKFIFNNEATEKHIKNLFTFYVGCSCRTIIKCQNFI